MESGLNISTPRLELRPWPMTLAQDSVPPACPWGSTNLEQTEQQETGNGVARAENYFGS